MKRNFVRGGVFVLAVLVALIVLIEHIHFWSDKGYYDDLVRLASQMEISPGQGKSFDYKDGQLLPNSRGSIGVRAPQEGVFVIDVDQSGGQLGVQGKIYASDGLLKTIVDSGAVYAEVMAFRRLSSNWWFYNNAQD